MKDQNEKQAIEEMAKVIETTEQIARDSVGVLPSPTMYAKDLYWKGYRKQSVGEWLEIDDGVSIGDGKHLECSKCGVWKQNRQRSNFCSHCGAKMKGDKNEQREAD